MIKKLRCPFQWAELHGDSCLELLSGLCPLAPVVQAALLFSMLNKMKHFSVNLALNVTVGSPAIPNWSVYGLSSSHIWMWDLDYKESWAPKNWCFWTVVLEKTLESPLDCKEIQPVHPKGDQSWVFIGRTDVEVETPILWPPDAMSWLIWKDPDAGKDWGQEEKGTIEDEMAGWHHWLNGHEFG